MAKTLTTANSEFTILIPDITGRPVTIEGYATDDAFAFEAVDVAETMMGVDAKMSAAYTPVIKPQNVILQADSASVDIFENWLSAQESIKELIFASGGNLALPGPGYSYVLVKGVLKNFKRPDGKKFLQPYTFQLHWESVQRIPLG